LIRIPARCKPKPTKNKTMSTPMLGTIMMFGGNFPPAGWALCNGQLMLISQNAALFSILGTTFGGNGTTTFGLPDFRGRAPVHWGQGSGLSNYVLGEITGTENTTLLYSNMPSHTHNVNCSSAAGNQATPGTALLAVESTGTSSNYTTGSADSTMNPNMVSVAGSGIPFSNIQPVLCVTFIIALTGTFPARN
jgi:microcystin-dependent protein